MTVTFPAGSLLDHLRLNFLSLDHDLGYRRNFRQRLQGWRLAPEAEYLHRRSPSAPATRRDRLHPGQHHLSGALHYHADHVANASLFAGSTWIVQKGDRDRILAPRPAVRPAV